MSYRPLPENIGIDSSAIDGTGIFALEDLPAGCELGITHIADDRFENGYIRTPLGGFFNHSEDPNCEAYKYEDFIKLRTIKSIPRGDELTAYYWLYEL